jgi:hypothetical protein
MNYFQKLPIELHYLIYDMIPNDNDKKHFVYSGLTDNRLKIKYLEDKIEYYSTYYLVTELNKDYEIDKEHKGCVLCRRILRDVDFDICEDMSNHHNQCYQDEIICNWCAIANNHKNVTCGSCETPIAFFQCCISSYKCNNCGDILCNNCSNECDKCDCNLCGDCSDVCNACYGVLCENCSYVCDDNDKIMCKHCIK